MWFFWAGRLRDSYQVKMSLGTLLNNADCGPSNPLQQLSKRLDTDQGVQQVTDSSGVMGAFLSIYMDRLSYTRAIRITLERAEQGHPERYRPHRCKHSPTNPTPYIYRYSTSHGLQIYLFSQKRPSSSRRVQHPEPSTSAGSQRRYRCKKHLLSRTSLSGKPHGNCSRKRFSIMTLL